VNSYWAILVTKKDTDDIVYQSVSSMDIYFRITSIIFENDTNKNQRILRQELCVQNRFRTFYEILALI
jgi:hypothetical protein